MENAAPVRAIVEGFYRSRLANDVDECLKYFAPDANCRIAGSPEASPVAVSANDESSLRRHLSELIAAWDWRAHEVESMTVDGDRAAVHFRLTTAFKPTGDVVSTEVVDLFTVRNGKIVSFVEFVDTALVAKVAAPG